MPTHILPVPVVAADPMPPIPTRHVNLTKARGVEHPFWTPHPAPAGADAGFSPEGQQRLTVPPRRPRRLTEPHGVAPRPDRQPELGDARPAALGPPGVRGLQLKIGRASCRERV